MSKHANRWMNRLRPSVRLLAAVIVIAFVWAWLLPMLGRAPVVQQRILYFRQAAINPSAMYYTELECLPPALAEVEQARKRHPDAFWKPFADMDP